MTRPRDTSTTTISAGVDDYAILDGATHGLRKILATNLPGGGGGGGAVDSVFGRTGTVSAATSDYDANQVDFTPAGNIAATDVQAAIAELDTEKQPLDATLTAFAGLTVAADTLPYGNGSDTFATTAFTSTARSLLDDSSTSAMRTTLGLAIGTNTQAYDADLDWVSGLSGTGFLSRTAATPTGTVRTLTAGTGISITNTAGVAGDPTFSLATKRRIAGQLDFVQPQANAAQPGVLTGASTPAESYRTWDFDNAAIEYLDVHGVLDATLPASTGCTLKFRTVSGGTTGNYIFKAALRKVSSIDLDTTAGDYSTNAQSATVATSGTVGTPTAVSIGFTTGTQMDSLAAGDAFVLRIYRDATNVLDTVNSNDVRLLQASLYLEEA